MKFRVPKESPVKRLDVFITENSSLNRSFAGKLIDQDKVTVNGRVEQASYKTKIGDDIEVDFDPKSLQVPEIDLPVIYEDENVIVIDKPIGVLTHSKGEFNPEATVASFIKQKVQFPQTSDLNDRAGIVHRLDRATSGVIICAKTPDVLLWLQKQFANRKVKKQYLAIVEGTVEPSEAIIDKPITRDKKNPKKFCVSTEGKPAETHYKVIKTNSNYSLLEMTPKTGRTHQLRVHLNSIDKPIVGDELYDGQPYERLLLHAHKLEVTLPDRTKHEFVAQIPKSFHTVMYE